MTDLLPILEKVAADRKSRRRYREDVEGEALTTLVINRLRGTIKAALSRRRALETVARRCWRTSPSSPLGRQVISEELGLKPR